MIGPSPRVWGEHYINNYLQKGMGFKKLKRSTLLFNPLLGN